MRKYIRWISLCIWIAGIAASAFASANEITDPTIRVYLRRLKVEDSMQIQLEGRYMLEDGSILFTGDSEFGVTLSDGVLVLHTEHASIRLGSSFNLIRCEEAAGLRINDSGLYEGDLSLSASDGVIRPILSIHVEDYLLGVVPYEMGDSFPLEALKAQAIAARTYALKKKGAEPDYDVEDTTNDQAYRGRSSSSPVSEQAVRETEGICGTYRDELAQCYYSASNGGQTELGAHVWPTTEPDAYGYMDMRDDPFDYENDASVVKRFTLPKKPKDAGVGELLHNALTAVLSPDLMALGRSVEADCIRIDEVRKVEVLNPKFDGDSRLMGEMRFDLCLSVRDRIHSEKPALQDTFLESDTDDTLATPAPVQTEEITYTEYEKLDGVFSVTLPIFPNAEQAMGLSINVYQNELFTVTDIGSAFMIESRRYGHGVGMSQRGAEQMARKYGMTFDEILSFYYPRMTVARFDYIERPIATPDMHVMATPAPTASPTPRPTLMPLDETNKPKGSFVAVVANIADDSSLNLREAPSLSAEVKRRLYKNQKLLVLNVGKDGWAHVKTDVIEGYVKFEFLQTLAE